MGDGGTTGEQTLNTGTHNVGETAGTSTDLADYQKSISCVDTANGNAPAGSTSGDSARATERERHDRLGHRLHDHQHA